ncbi:MAG: type VI secretion system baseplate subunit TssK [Solimonas sp.]
MSSHNKVVWSEGLFLRPQHFQQQDRYLERYVDLKSAALSAEGWGFSELEIDRDLLAVGKLALRRARGVFPDGTPFAMPDDDPLPPPLELDAQVRDRTVLLALPLRRPGRAELDRRPDSDRLVRYRVRDHEAYDATVAGSDVSAPIEVCGLQARCLLAGDAVEDYACIPLAQVVEVRNDRQVTLDEAFMPSVLNLRAAPRLATFATELLGLLHQRGDALAGRVTASGRGGAAEIADFLLLQCVNRNEPLAAHYAGDVPLHPLNYYRWCAGLAGELATFTLPGKRPAALPPYRHDDLKRSFEPVIAALRASLSAVLEQTAIAIPLELKKFGVRVATIADRTLYDGAAFVLAARADLPGEELRQRFPAMLKIGPVEKIRDLVNLQLPGIRIAAMPVAPRQIPYHAGAVYFELDRNGSLWAQLKTAGGMAMHLGGEFPGLELEMWAIRT